MENEQLAIRQQMEGTRASITEKLETLENKVSSDIQGATGAVTDTVDAVKDTVESVKSAVADSVEGVKEVVHSGVEEVKHWFDITAHVQTHPWAVLGGAAVVGFALETLLIGSSSSKSASSYGVASTASASSTGQRAAHNGNGASQSKKKSEKSGPSWFAQFAPQISMLKELALGTIMGAVKESVMKAAPAAQAGLLTKLFNSVSETIGVEPTPSSPAETDRFRVQGESNIDRENFSSAKVGRPMGPTRGQV